MKIPNEEHVQFLETLLERTKNGKLIWKHNMKDSLEHTAKEMNEALCILLGVDRENGIEDNSYFSCCIQDRGEQKFVILARGKDSDVFLSVNNRESIAGSVSLEPQSSEASSLALRLYFVVYDRFPSLEKNIRSFLSEYIKSDK